MRHSMKKQTPGRSVNFYSLSSAIMLALALAILSPRPLMADITTTGVVTPETVTTGTVTGTAVFIGDPDSTGSLTVDGGSSLLVDNVNGGIGLGLFFNEGALTISGIGTSVEVNARSALVLNNPATVLINGGSYVLLNGSDTRPCALCTFNRGRAMDVFGGGTVTIEGAGTQVDLVRRLRVADGQLNVINGAMVDMDGTDSSLITSFVVGQNGTTGGLVLDGGATFLSLVPQALIGVGGPAMVDILGFSTLELTTSARIGGASTQATVNITDSSLRILADPAVPDPETGNINLGRSGTGVINVVRGLVEAENDVYVGRDASGAGSGSFSMNDNSSAVIGGNLYISHNGVDNAGLDPAYVLACDSTLNATETFIGENGELAGTTVNGNITVEGGTLSPGCSPGQMTVNGNVAFVNGQLLIEIDGPSALDQLTALGDVTFAGGNIVLEFGNGYAPPEGTSLALEDYLTADNTTGIETINFEVEGVQGPNGSEFEFEVDENGTVVTTTDAVPVFVEVLIDIRPSGPNFVDPNSDQLFPVAILSTQDTPIFDATMVDPATIEFGPNGAQPILEKTRLKDLDGDGDLDLLVWFRISHTGLGCADESADMTGQTFAGTDFVSSDEVIVLGCD